MRDRWVSAVLALGFLALAGCANVECRLKRMECNDDCGDGVLGKLCQDLCTYQYHECLESKGERGR